MPDAIPTHLERLERQRTDALSTIDAVLARCNDDDREPTDIENQALTDARATLERAESGAAEWTELLERRAGGDELRNRVHGALARSGQANGDGPHAVRRDEGGADITALYRSAGQYASDFVIAHGHHAGYGTDREYEAATRRLERAVANQTTGDNLGILPTPIIAPVVTFIATSRPAVQSVTQRPLPASGKTFSRPVVTQHTTVGPQSAEKTELPSQKMTITPLQVTKNTYGGTLDISFQDRDWTDPAILQIVIDDLAGEYALQTDAAFCTALADALTLTVPLADAGSSAEWLAAIYNAAAGIAASTLNQLPDTLWVSTDVWAALGKLVDDAGRPLFPVLGPVNAEGTMNAGTFAANPFGLRLVVDGRFAPKTAIVGIARYAEYFEQIGGMVSVTEPSILGYQVAYYGYFASCVPAPTAFRGLVIGTMPLLLGLEDDGNGNGGTRSRAK